ncbi:Ferredoxin-dependent glutamate synthase 2 [Koleobacter methoxysyntrophicus]|uniref:Ferredoxin-dependent glutamate synthase 2 n=1 Tax=Koleobacter methoxysyntrophicus TaxID=2751313 RepID=A0A8A0RLM4_9FIRM|nr:glutamate synthase [Koleobacter methoxysyntrophicus]QSQ08419.1 Ferredoxin-dependent glutamate synthase 2 [Koleobacter methoxysyntrophicus]
MVKTIDAYGLHYKDLNNMIKKYHEKGVREFRVKRVSGQRYIGSGIHGKPNIVIEGTPGNDLAAFSDGVNITVKGNAQDAVGNTMNDGILVVHGHAGDTVGYSMRGGKIYIKSYAGYRVGIHLKQYQDKIPVIIIGGRVGDFLGEYMAGGINIVLGLDVSADEEIVGSYCGTGMHGGVMYIRGDVAPYKLGKGIKSEALAESDMKVLKKHLSDYCDVMGIDLKKVISKTFTKLYAYNKRPYGKLYAY